MKKILLIVLMLLIPIVAVAGVDDSGLQTYTIDFSKQTGMRNSVSISTQPGLNDIKVNNNTDTFFSDYCLNMQLINDKFINVGYGYYDYLSIFPHGYDDFKFFSISNYLILYQYLNPGVKSVTIKNIDGTQYSDILGGSFTKKSDGAYLTISNAVSLKNTSRVYINPYKPTSKDNLIFFSEENGLCSANVLVSGALLISDKCVYDNFPFYSYESCAEEWNGRLFIGTETSSVYFSSTLDYTDFSISGTTGGLINMPDGSNIKCMKSNSIGLFIFTSSGVWLLSGDTQPSSWSLKKINTLITTNSANWNKMIVCGDYNKIFFVANKTLYILEDGVMVTPISILSGDYTDINFYANKIYLFCNSGYANPCYYDIQTTSFYNINARNSTNNLIGVKAPNNSADIIISIISKNDNIRFLSNRSSIGGYTTYDEVYWESSPLSLSGLNNYKKIKRIEIDCDFGGKNRIGVISKAINYTYKYLTNYTITDDFDKCFFYVLNPKDDSQLFSKELTFAEHNYTSYGIKTFTIKNAINIPADTQFKFAIKAYGYLAIKQIRIYYYNYGDYKMNGR